MMIGERRYGGKEWKSWRGKRVEVSVRVSMRARGEKRILCHKVYKRMKPTMHRMIPCCSCSRSKMILTIHQYVHLSSSHLIILISLLYSSIYLLFLLAGSRWGVESTNQRNVPLVGYRVLSVVRSRRHANSLSVVPSNCCSV